MSTLRTLALSAAALALSLASPAGAVHLFVPLAPCRVVDTRLAGGRLAPGETRSFQVAGTTDFESQGGISGGCGVPLDAAAVSFNLIAVAATGAGHLEGWATGGPIPTASVINYSSSAATGNLNIANGVILPIAAGAGPHLDARANVSSAFLVADVTGYFVDWTQADGPGSGLDADTLDGLGSEQLGQLPGANVWLGTNRWFGGSTLSGPVIIGGSNDQVLLIRSHLQGATPLLFEGQTVDRIRTTLAVADPTADRTITLPDAGGEVSVLGQSIEGAEIADVVRSVPLPLGAIRSCNENEPLDGSNGSDQLADFASSAGSMVIEWDAEASSPDENYLVCATLTIPPDYQGDPVLRFEIAKSGDTLPSEEITLRLVGGGGNQGLVPRTIAQASRHFMTIAPSDLFEPGTTYTLRIGIGGAQLANLNDVVTLFGAELRYTAGQ